LQKWLDGELDREDLSNEEQQNVMFRVRDGMVETTTGASTSIEQAKAMVGACQEMSFGQIGKLIETINNYEGAAAPVA
jgi:hypothetical protein